ncbi:hypothetical protein [Engelhardtia mirabilis]
MLDLLLSALLPNVLEAPGVSIHSPAAFSAQDDDPVEVFERRYEAALGDEDALWSLYEWTGTFGLEREGRKVLRALIKLDEDNARARGLLGHVKYDGKWYDSQAKADSAREKAEAKEAKAKGWVKFKDQWVDPAHVPFLERGLVQDGRGKWVSPEDLKRAEEGWVQQDYTWVAPDEMDKMRAGLWKVGDEWLTTEEANKRHAELLSWWRIPGDNFELWTTCDREVAEKVQREVDRTFSDLKRFYGTQPAAPPRVVVLRSTDQYNEFAAGVENVRPATELLGWSSIHGAYFADALYLEDVGFVGAGVGYWDPATDATAAFGRHYVRHAAGLAFAEGIDPSPDFVARVLKNPRTLERDLDSFYDEKSVPMVLRYGAAAWVERYFVDTAVAVGGDPHWASKWSVQNIMRKGGLDPLERILDFNIRADDPSGGGKLINEAGLLVSFIMSGESPAVSEAHKAWRAALAAGEDLDSSTTDLFKALVSEDAAFRNFAQKLGG